MGKFYPTYSILYIISFGLIYVMYTEFGFQTILVVLVRIPNRKVF